jgi:peptide chain release factor 3
LRFDAIPRFEPERFAAIRNTGATRYKQFHRGLQQLEEEGAIQVFATEGAQRDLVLGAVGDLQFDVVAARLADEYGVPVAVDRLPYVVARWLVADPAAVAAAVWPYAGVLRVRDREDRAVVLFQSQRDADRCAERNPDLDLRPLGSATR